MKELVRNIYELENVDERAGKGIYDGGMCNEHMT